MPDVTPRGPHAPAAQHKYEVRFDWAADGLAHVAEGAGVIVVVDALPSAAAADTEHGSAFRVSDESGELAGTAAAFRTPVLAATLRNRSAVARWVLARQEDAGERIRVAVIATAEQREDGSTRFAVEDLLAAGAVIDALAEVGIDYCSPEAAAACAAFTGLSRATRHLLSASETGVALIGAGGRGVVSGAADLDVSDDVPVLKGGVFEPGEFRARA